MSLKLMNASYDKMMNYEALERAHQELNLDEERVNLDLQNLFLNKSALEHKMDSLQMLLPNLQLIENDTEQLTGRISFTSSLAHNVSCKVRQLDLAKNRVSVCMQRVEDILDLKFCTDGVQTALQDEDYEQAAAHIHRFLALDEDILRMSADANEGSTLDMSFKLLHEAQTKLKSIIHNKFDAAVQVGDAASVERFFKTFPLIGEHKAGLNKFSKYLCAQLSESLEKKLKTSSSKKASSQAIASDDKGGSKVKFSDDLTLIFEEVARVIEIHQPLVETYYGPGRMLTMIEMIQKECDRHVRSVVRQLKTESHLDKKVQIIQQSLLYQKTSIEKVEPKEVDIILAEITILNTRAELYLRFMRRRIYNDIEVANQDEEVKKDKIKEADIYLNTCELNCLMQEFIGSYILMEEYFMRQMVIKAVSMDNSEEGSLVSSMVDDSFFIVKKCVRRALSSSNVDGVCAMLNHACTILEQDFREILFNKLRQGFPSGFDLVQAYNLVQSTFSQGRLQNAEIEAEKTRAAFLVTLNNAGVSCEYIQKLKVNIEGEIDKLYSQVNQQAKAKLQSCLTDLGLVSSRFKEVLDFGFNQLISSWVKPRLKQLIDAFLTVGHNLSEDDFSNYEANDPWVQNFIFNLKNILSSFKTSLTDENYYQLITEISNEITLQLEKVLLKSTFNRLGGLQLDKELRTLIGYLTSITTWSIRDRFSRLTQMTIVLNLEKVSEINDYWGRNSGPLTWRLTPGEVRQVLILRVDFKSEEIKSLKL